METKPNFPSQWNRGTPTAKPPRKPPSKLRGLVAFLILVALAGGAAWYLFMPKAEKKAERGDDKTRLIKDIGKTNAVKTTTNATAAVKAKPKKIPYWKQDNTNGFSEAMLRKWHNARRPPASWTNTTTRTETPPAYCIFKHQSENVIAGYLTMEPGETLVGTPMFGRRFEEDFKKSYETPIIVLHTDPPEIAELKRLMNQTKADLKARMDEGESISKILEDTHADLQRLSCFKQDLMAEIYKVKKDPNATLEDVETMIEAANKMLDAKGVAPIKLSPITKRMLTRHKGQNSSK